MLLSRHTTDESCSVGSDQLVHQSLAADTDSGAAMSATDLWLMANGPAGALQLELL